MKEKPMKLSILLFSLIFIAGCACKPTIVTKDQIVKVPVQVPCKVPEIPKPTWFGDALTVNQNIFDQVKTLLAEITQREQYEIKLEAAIRTCNDN